jgi:predicted Zn-dependent protease
MTKKRCVIGLVLLSVVCVTATYADEILLPDLGDSSGALVSPQQAFRVGQSFYWQLQQSVDLIDDPEITHYLRDLGWDLVSNSHAQAQEFTFFMVPDSSVNAFAAPGGFIGVHSGLMLTSETEDELASVLAHEISHVTQRHLLRSFEKAKQMDVPMMAAMVGAILLGAANPQAGQAALMAVQAGGVQMQLNFTRSHEREADNLGMQTLARAGFDPNAMPQFFERLDKTGRFYQGKEAIPEFLLSHPVTTERIADARGRAVAYPKQEQMRDQQQFYLMREKLRVLTTTNMVALVKQYATSISLDKILDSPKARSMRYGHALALLASTRYTEARAALTPLLKQDPDRISYQLALADIERSVGHVKTALKIYEDNLALYPGHYALTVHYARTLMQEGDTKRSIQLLTDLISDQTPSLVYKLLSQVTGDAGDNSRAHRWLAEYYYGSGQLKQAADQLRLAAEVRGRDEYARAQISSRLREVEYAIDEMEVDKR